MDKWRMIREFFRSDNKEEAQGAAYDRAKELDNGSMIEDEGEFCTVTYVEEVA